MRYVRVNSFRPFIFDLDWERSAHAIAEVFCYWSWLPVCCEEMALNFSDSDTDNNYFQETDEYSSDWDTDLSSICEDFDENETRPIDEFEVKSYLF